MQAAAATDGAQIYFVEDGLIPRVELLLEAGLWKDLVAAVVAMVNVAGGFALTHKMLSSFTRKGDKKEEQ